MYPAMPSCMLTRFGPQDHIKGSLVQAAPGAVPVKPGAIQMPTKRAANHLDPSDGGLVVKKMCPEPKKDLKAELMLQNVYLREESPEPNVYFDGLPPLKKQLVVTNNGVTPPWRRNTTSATGYSHRPRCKPNKHQRRRHRFWKQAAVDTSTARLQT